jgi:hypothetical protein
MTVWSLVYGDFNPDQEKLREALCTLGNGYFATRGASSESRALSVLPGNRGQQSGMCPPVGATSRSRLDSWQLFWEKQWEMHCA